MGFDRNRETLKTPDKTLVQRSSELFKLSGSKPKVEKEKPDKKPYGGYYPSNPADHLKINCD
jgi:hypothetical protein